MKAEASFYIPREAIKEKVVDEVSSTKFKGMILEALENQRSRLTFDLKTLCDNLTLANVSEFTQRYAVGAITKILRGQPVTNRTMLDSLFNTYASILNATLIQTGYNSVMAMKNAAIDGTINPSNFLGALDQGLRAMQEEAESRIRFERYGEEIPIDIVEECAYKYFVDAPEKKTEGGNLEDYITSLESIEIKLTGHIKNKNAELWEMNDFSYKIADAMSLKKPLALRVGKTIYEGIYLLKYEPTITNIHDIKFTATIRYRYQPNNKSIKYKQTGVRIVPYKYNTDLANKTSSSVYAGSYPVTKVTKKDTTIIAQAKKALGKDKLWIDGEYV